MKIAVFSSKSYDRRFFDAANTLHRHQLSYFEARLTRETAPLAHGFEAVCAFVNDRLDSGALARLSEAGVNLLLLRSAGYNHADLEAAADLNIVVTHVPNYSPHSVAEHAAALMLALNRRIPHAFVRVREGNFSIEGLLGFDMHGKTAGLIGAGHIGAITGRILQGFGCKVLAYDPAPSEQAVAANFEFGMLEDVISASDIVSLHCPLTPSTRHLIGRLTLPWFKRGAMLINTSRGGLIDTRAVIESLENGLLGSLGIDVYEDEAEIFFEDHSRQGLGDDVFSRLIAMPNVLVTGHQGFFTEEAMQTIAETSLKAATDFAAGRTCAHVLTPASAAAAANGSRPATA
ncbi:2-hydroxyacid dehydrogenase [Geminisphaera colitermitum]|uniref:2-hydroxyacid dehydrogenase n=1 Tax=Geminisphaera colitermitum TaxID=1148786 RepID=UPI000158D378|nr:2-hydroxyacid dehydrogenase [Geminisphaera colitermitum]